MTLIILILILGVLIFVHELGHFIAAKWAGVYVHEFALGMGPKLFSFKRKNKKDPTLYSLRAFPIGGFCAMAGEVLDDEESKKIKKSELLCNKTKWQRFVIMFAGVFLNFVFALIILFFQSIIWGHVEQKAIVGSVPTGYPVEAAGIEVGDEVKAINGYKIKNWDKLTIVLNLKTKDNVYEFEVKKSDNQIKKYTIVPKIETNAEGKETKTFGIGGSTKIYKGIIPSIKYAFTKLGSVMSTMSFIIGSLFTGKLSLDSLSGPVGMYSVVGESAKIGMEALLFLTAYLSINLGFVNAIPFPAFDGGRILFILIEAITKKKVNQKVENMLHTIGFFLLMTLMVYITIRDIIKLF